MKNIKIGRITLAFTFIAFGIIIFLGKITSFNSIDLLFKIWPIIIIVLGLEIIFSTSSKGENYKRSNNLDIPSISVIIIVVIILGSLSLSLKLSDLNFSSEFININNNYNSVVLEEVIIDESKKLIIDESHMDIDVIKSENSNVKVRLEGQERKNEDIKKNYKNLLEVTRVQGGTKLTRETKKNNIYFMKTDLNKMRYVVELPTDINLEIISKSGDITINDTEGNVNIKTNASNIDFENIKGDISILNDSGDFDGKNLTGNIDVVFKNGDVDLDSRFVKSVDIQADNGNVSLKLPKDQTGKFNIVATYGDIYDELGFNVIKSASTDSINELRKTGSPVFNVRANNGDITIETD